MFELCGKNDDIKSKYFLFGIKFEYFFYTAWCNNMGGFVMAAFLFPSWNIFV